MRLGARIFKTGLSVTLALYVAGWLDFQTPAFAALAAFFAVQPSVRKSLTLIWDQIQANVLSAILAVVFVLAFGQEPFVVGAVVLLIIAIHIQLKKEAIIPLAVVTAIIIMGSPTTDFMELAFNRFLLIMIGVFSAFAVNLVFLPPKHENQLYHKITDVNDDIIQWIRLLLHHEVEYRTLKEDLKKQGDQLNKIDETYLLYKDERGIFRRQEYATLRKVVLFRQMVRSTRQAHRILENLTMNDNLIHQLPEEMAQTLRLQLDDITNYHERVLLKYAGKVKPHATEDYYEEVSSGKKVLMTGFLKTRNDSDFEETDWMTFLPVVAQVIEYCDDIEYLDRLVDRFYNYHTEDNEVFIKERSDY